MACGAPSTEEVEPARQTKPVEPAEASTDQSAFAPISTPTCTDGVKNGTETDVDCGGACSPCADGKACAVAAKPALQSLRRAGAMARSIGGVAAA